MRSENTTLPKVTTRLIQNMLENPHLSPEENALDAGFSEKNLHQRVNKLLDTDKVRAAVKREVEKQSDLNSLAKRRILKEYTDIAFSSLMDVVFVNDNGTLGIKDSKDWPKHIKVSVSEITTTAQGKILKIKLQDKQKALDALAKSKNMFVTELRHSGGVVNLKPDLEDEELAKIIEGG